MVQAEKMASLGQLAAGVAHEINNPLTGILMYGNLMKEKLEGDHPFHSNLTCILEDAERCRDIVKNLLAYSRQSSTSRERFSLNTFVDRKLPPDSGSKTVYQHDDHQRTVKRLDAGEGGPEQNEPGRHQSGYERP